MNKVEKIKQEIERLDEKYRELRVSGTMQQAKEADLVVHVLLQISNFIDSLSEEPNMKNEMTDYTKSNEEKAKEICGKGNPCCNKLCQFCNLSFVIDDVKQMAEWKDRQFKQDLDNAFKSADHVQYMNGYNKAVEKACEWLRNVTYFDYGARMFEYGTFIKDFKKAM